jgi:hypothetical protein
MGGKKKNTLQDYQELAREKGFIYISSDIPINTRTSGGCFQCQFGHQWNIFIITINFI